VRTLVRTLRESSQSLNATVLQASKDVKDAMAEQTTKLVAEVGNLSVTLGGVFDNTQEDVKYIPLDDYLTDKLLADAQSDFNSSELVFEHEL